MFTDPIAEVPFVDAVTRPVYVDSDGRQFDIDDGQPVYGVWVHQRDIAAAFGVAEETVSRWLTRAREGSAEALLARPSTGHPPRLSPEQKCLIPEFLWHGSEAYGFRGEV